MTIVAGFKCKNGVVLLADTEHTATSTKFNAPKMWSDGDRSIVANAGANDYTKDAIDELSLKFSQRKMKWTAATVRTAVKKVLVDVHQRIRSAYSASDPDRPQVYLMLAARLDDWSTILIKASETATPLVNTFDFIGAGQDIARFLISP